MTYSSVHFKRFIYLFVCCFFCNLLVFAGSFSGKPAGIAPEATDVRNFLIQNISGRSQILPLTGSDPDGVIVFFKILSLPAPAAGTLYLNHIPVSVNQELTPLQAKQLQFEVQVSFTGTASFTYTVKDNEGLSDATGATFSIPVTDDGKLLVCTGGGLGTNILGVAGTFSAPFITANPAVSCINDGSTVAAPLQNLGNSQPTLTSYTYGSTSNSLGPEGTYSFLKTLGTMDVRNCIKTDWVASDHTGDGGYAMIVNGSPNSASYGKTFYQAEAMTVCPNTLYEFSAYVINVLPGNHSAAQAGTEPNISFYINDQLVSTSGAIQYSDASTDFIPQWVKVGGLWYSGPNTSADLRIDNATFVAGGNDLGLDDISLAICGPEITYPDISLTPMFCSYGVLPLKADVKASVNTYSSYIFQNSTDGGVTWIDMGTPATGNPVYNTVLNSYEYLAEYGDIPVDPGMNGYMYRLKVATEEANLTGTSCNVFADKVITVSAFDKPLAGADITGCNSATTASLQPAGTDEIWSPVSGNPSSAVIDQLGNVSGMTENGIYRFQLSNTSGCADTVSVMRMEMKDAGEDVYICSPLSTYKLDDAGTGYKWEKVAGNPADADIDVSSGLISGMTADGTYHFILRSDLGGCTSEILVIRSSLELSSSQTDVACFGESTGSIDLNITGGIAPYTFLWSNGQTAEDLSGLAAGDYSVTVTDSKGCTITGDFTINQPLAALALSHTQVNVNCFGENTGSINLSATGGTSPYTYSWSNGQSTEDLSSLTAGDYSVTITDANGCIITAYITIVQPAAALTLTHTQINVNCFGESTGSINLSVTGGTAPYTYSWSNGQSTEDLSNLTAGDYSVTVTDANGCSITADITITQPAVALALTYTQTNVNCYGESTGSIDLSVTGGTAPYTYSWSNGQSTEDLSSLTAGDYSVIVTDANGCTITADVTITQPAAALALTYTQTNVNCYGESTGSIDLSVTGGTAPYTYSWSDGQSTEDLSNLAVGDYSVTVTDANGCSITADITITQPTAALALTYTQTNVNCFGENTGSINLSVTGGTVPYTYSWSNGQSTEDLSNLTAGDYSVTVTDANGCSITADITITQPAVALALTYTQTNVNCFGENTGSINLSTTGGTAPYTYSWSNGQSTEDLSSLTAGDYSVTITDANGCIITADITIAQPAAALTLTHTQINVNCFGESTGSINLSVTGGTAPYTYSWSNGQSTEDLSNLTAGDYSVTVTDANGCNITADITITQPADALSASFTQVNVNCYSESTGSINLSVTGGTAPYAYSWNNGEVTEDLSNLIAGNYSVIVTDANGCTITADITITQPTAALSLTYTQTNVNCYGESTGSIDLSVTGGTAPYTYSWSNGQSTEDLSNLTAGDYSVTVTDVNGCITVADISITQPAAALSLSHTQVNVNCFGESTGSIDLSVSGGTAPYTYSWSNGQVTEDLSNLAAGDYSVIVTDVNGCTITEDFTISQPLAALALSHTQVNVNCFGESTGSINLSVSGGTAPYTYSWSNGQSTEDLSNLAAGDYSVTVTDANSCTLTADITIAQPTAALALTYTQTNVNCFGESTGSINLSVTGGTAPYAYSWSNGQSTEDLNNLAAGDYSVTVTDVNGCTTVADVSITQPVAALSLSHTQINVNCFGENTGSINLSISGGTAPYTYSWSDGVASEDLSNLIAGNYSVIVTDANGCTALLDITITQPAAALALTYTQTNVNCFGESTGSINLSVTGGTAPYAYSWSNGQSTEDLNNLAAGDYSVTVTDVNGCTTVADVSITQPVAALSLSHTQINVNCFGENTGSINLSISGGTAPYTYSWSNGQSTEDLSNLAAGNYSVTVTDANGCSITADITIGQPAAALTLTHTQTNVNCFGESTGSIDLSVIGGTASYTYSWSNGQVTEDLINLAAGDYSVTVTDANGCTAVADISITQSAAALSLNYTQVNVNCFGESTGSIDLSVTGGTVPYTYSWNNGQVTENLSSLAAGDYSVIVTDANGCTITADITITQPTVALALTYIQTNVSCYGESTGSIDLNVTGGTAPYAYSWNNGQSTEDLSNLAAGDYSVTVTDANGCTITADITITQPTTALSLTHTQTNVNCYGESNGTIDLTVSGGTAPYTYSWSNGQSTEDLNNLAAGDYSVTVTDVNGCTTVADVSITQPVAALSLSHTQINVNCFGENTGSINLSISGGTAPYTYSWSDGVASEDLSGLTAGDYSVTVTDANGCTVVADISITQPTAVLSLSHTQININCYGESTGSIDLSVTGGTAPYTYSWSNGQSTEDLSNLAAGDYSVTVTDANGCTITAYITITQPVAALALTYTQINVNCYGESTGSIDLNVSGGTAPYTYSWNNGQSTEDLNTLAAGDYSVTVTDANGCTITADITITQPTAALSLTYTQTNVNCYGESTGSIDLSVTGGTAPYTYSWSNGQSTEDLINLAARDYSVTVTDANGCIIIADITITQPPAALTLTYTQINVNCYGESTGSIDLSVSGGTAPYTYSWSNGQSIEDLSNLAAGDYSVTVTDANGCAITADITIIQPVAALTLTYTQTNVNCYGESTGSIDLSVSGGTAPYTYSWSNGQSIEDLSNLAAGDYSVTVTDANGCAITADITIIQPVAALTLTYTQTNVNCFGESSGSIDLSVTGGTAPYTYSWSNGQSTEDLSNLAARDYSVTVTDANSCTITADITIAQPTAALALTYTQTNVNCYGESSGSIDLSVSGGTAPYTYSWSNGQVTEDLSNLAAGDYSVTITDASGCVQTGTFVITQPGPLKMFLSVQNPTCPDSSNGEISVTITGGTAPYRFVWNGIPGTSVRNNITPGEYEIVVTDANGCTISTQTRILSNDCSPVAVDDIFSIQQETILRADVSLNDHDPQNGKLSFTKLSDPANGTIRFNESGKFTFTPDTGFSGKTEFMYQVCNISGICTSGKVIINVIPYTIVNLTPSLSNVREGNATAVTARLVRPVDQDVSITVEYSGSAQKDADYLLLDNYITLNIPGGQTTTTEKITIAALIDGFEEGDEDIIIRIKTVSDNNVRIGTGARVIINDVYPPPPPTDKPQDEPINNDIVPDPLLSPNNDGNGNEFFNIKNIESYPDNEVIIFNRWGNELFYIKNYNNDDRSFKGYANKGLLVNPSLPLADGVYFYMINTYRTDNGQRIRQMNKGYLILKR